MNRIPAWVERVLLGTGLALLGIWAFARVDRVVMSRASLLAFDRSAATAVPDPGATSDGAPGLPASPGGSSGGVDFSLWSPERIAAYREALGIRSDPPLAVLEIPKIGLVVPVLPGTDEVALNRGVGHITGTPLPGSPGNVGIAGHRDGFFRGLKDVVVGDRLRLVTGGTAGWFRVDEIRIVSPKEVSVLDDIGRPAVTLVTCHPFWFVGSAPDRFIVRAVREDHGR